MATGPAATILVIDDAPENLAALSALLQPTYRVLAATSGAVGLQIAAGPLPPDLILLDVMMPELDGYAVLERLRSDPLTADIPVVMLTALAEPTDEEAGLRAGASDYITKPIKPPLLLARVRTQLLARQAGLLLRDRNASLEAEVQQRLAENSLTQRVTVRALAHLAEARDPETGNHILRTQAYVQRLAVGLRGNPRFDVVCDDRYVQLLTLSAPLHDIGKVAIPDSILRKPGKLTNDEWVIMKTHSQRGAEAIEQAERDIEMPLHFLSVAKEITRWHHEKWDGSGYPDGLAGEAIPVSARLMAVADVFDALISPRVYKAAMSYDKARAIIAESSGQHFDPDVAAVLLDHCDDFIDIAERHRESPEG